MEFKIMPVPTGGYKLWLNIDGELFISSNTYASPEQVQLHIDTIKTRITWSVTR